MRGLVLTGIYMTVGVATAVALLTRVFGGTRISRRAGVLIVILACLLWHALAWVSIDCTTGFVHRILTYSIIVPFGCGVGDGPVAFVIALAVQATLAAGVAAALFWLLRKDRREPGVGR